MRFTSQFADTALENIKWIPNSLRYFRRRFTFTEKGNKQTKELPSSGYTWVFAAYSNPAVAAEPVTLGTSVLNRLANKLEV